MNMNIPLSAPVMVTGSTGYVAGVLVNELLKAGLTVHCPVRSPDKPEKIEHLMKAAAKTNGTLKFFKADLLERGSYYESMQGCSVVFHTASPFVMHPKNIQKDLLEPAIHGTEYVLESVAKTPSVTRVVLTSSCYAIASDPTDTLSVEKCNEEVWNASASKNYNPYAYSKVLAEKKAWEIAKAQSHYKLVVINPAWVMGPGLKASASSESYAFIKMLGDGTMKSGVPNLGVWVVDVRDVATAHVKAGFLPDAEGRNIISARNCSLFDIALAIREKYPNYPLPKSKAPWFIVYLLAPFMGLERTNVWRSANLKGAIDNTKSIEKLKMTYHTQQETFHEMFKQMIDVGMIPAI